MAYQLPPGFTHAIPKPLLISPLSQIATSSLSLSTSLYSLSLCRSPLQSALTAALTWTGEGDSQDILGFRSTNQRSLLSCWHKEFWLALDCLQVVVKQVHEIEAFGV